MELFNSLCLYHSNFLHELLPALILVKMDNFSNAAEGCLQPLVVVEICCSISSVSVHFSDCKIFCMYSLRFKL